jgi:hypothetical protein
MEHGLASVVLRKLLPLRPGRSERAWASLMVPTSLFLGVHAFATNSCHPLTTTRLSAGCLMMSSLTASNCRHALSLQRPGGSTSATPIRVTWKSYWRMYRPAPHLRLTRTPIDMTSWFGTQRSEVVSRPARAGTEDPVIEGQLDLLAALVGLHLKLRTEPANLDLEQRRVCHDGGSPRYAAAAASIRMLSTDRAAKRNPGWRKHDPCP